MKHEGLVELVFWKAACNLESPRHWWGALAKWRQGHLDHQCAVALFYFEARGWRKRRKAAGITKTWQFPSQATSRHSR